MMKFRHARMGEISGEEWGIIRATYNKVTNLINDFLEKNHSDVYDQIESISIDVYSDPSGVTIVKEMSIDVCPIPEAKRRFFPHKLHISISNFILSHPEIRTAHEYHL